VVDAQRVEVAVGQREVLEDLSPRGVGDEVGGGGTAKSEGQGQDEEEWFHGSRMAKGPRFVGTARPGGS
jgi:hypothetical protein